MIFSLLRTVVLHNSLVAMLHDISCMLLCCFFCRIDITRNGSEKFKQLKIENKFEGENSTHSNMELLWSHTNLMLKQEKVYCKDSKPPIDTTEIPMISTEQKDGKYYSANVRHSWHMT